MNGAPNAARAERSGKKGADGTRRTMKTLLTAAMFREGDGKLEGVWRAEVSARATANNVM